MCLGVALDALTLFGEILTVAVFDSELFDSMSRDFVDRNDEGAVLTTRLPFDAETIGHLIASGRLAPAGAGCLTLAWRQRQNLLST
jgi:hypothetical protein